MAIDGEKRMLQRKRFEPQGDSACLCGSGQIFKLCCSAHLSSKSSKNENQNSLNIEFSESPLIASRVKITQYTILHKTNTEPFMQVAPSAIEAILKIDIDALSELTNELRNSYVQGGREEEFSAALERLRSNINDNRWQRKIAYFHSIHALGSNWNIEAGRLEFRKLGAMSDETDVEILQLYIDLFGEELSFSENQDLADQIIYHSTDIIDHLQYRTLKAAGYLGIGDRSQAVDELSHAITSYRSQRDALKESVRGTDLLMNAIGLLATINNDNALREEAISLGKQLLRKDCWTNNGRASILRKIGDALRSKSSWREAYDVYTLSYTAEPAEIYKVFLAECLLHTSGWEAAAAELLSFAPGVLNKGEFVDYAFTLAIVALEGDDRSLLQKAEALLRSAQISVPYFRTQCDTLLLAIVDTLRSGRSPATVGRVKMAIGNIASLIGRYLILQPNISGVGINLNQIISDLKTDTEGTKKITRKSDNFPKR